MGDSKSFDRIAPIPLVMALVATYITSTIGSHIAGIDFSWSLLVYAAILLASTIQPESSRVHSLGLVLAVPALTSRTLGYLDLIIKGSYNLTGPMLLWVTVLVWGLSWHYRRIKEFSPQRIEQHRILEQIQTELR